MSRQPLRLWPAVAIVVLQLLGTIVGPLLVPDLEGLAPILFGVIGAALTVLWWLFASGAPWLERIGALAVMAAVALAVKLVVHESIAGGGQGMFAYIFATPLLALGLIAWAALTRGWEMGARRAAFVPVILIACIPVVLIRTAGIRGSGAELHWRWTPTPEQLLLARGDDEPKPLPPANASPAPTAPAPTAPAPAAPAPSAPAPTAPAPTAPAPVAPAPSAPTPLARPAPLAPLAPPEWPGFRGPDRDGVVHGVRINTDWAAAPPVEIWRRAIGPGWSSFAVSGDYLYTQEQRGPDEIVACYRVSTGEPVWRHRDPVRFWESNGGPGPRATPTLSDGRVYTSGATGILNALDARTGAVLWSHNVAAEAKVDTPMWGFSASPLIVGDLVIAAASGALAAYDRVTGQPRWLNASRGGSYSSPHRVVIDGVEQILLLGGPGAISVSPVDGTLLWEHAFDGGAIVQPAALADGDVVINAIAATGGTGTRRLHVTRGESGWNLEERWTSNGLKPYFNDFVVHKGHAFGFDGSILSSINLVDGKRNWKGGRYGNGQMVLLADQDLLLVISEEGELALVSATTDQYREVAKFPVFTAKTWNHPVVIRDVLLVRNGEEMAAFRLSLAEQTSDR